MSQFQDVIPRAMMSEKYIENMDTIANSYGAMGIES
jgi:hypothetical protein